MDSGIYVISSPSGRVYIGSSKQMNVRKRQHFYKLGKGVHPCEALQRAWKKYGDKLNFVVMELCPVEKLIEREQHWIDTAKLIWVGRIYNASSIAGRPEHTIEVRNKMAAAARGRIVSDETRKKLSEAGKGRKHTPETLKKIKARKFTPEQLAKVIKNNQDRAMTAEHIQKIKELGKRNKGRTASVETRQKMSEAQKRRTPHSEETKLKLSLSKTGKKYKPTSPEGLAAHKIAARKRADNARLKRELLTISSERIAS